MKELSPAARALIESGKGALDPAPADQDRVLAALQPRVLAGEGPAGPFASSPPAVAPKPWGLISVGGVGAALVAGALAWGLAPDAAPPAVPARVEEATPAPASAPPIAADSPAAAPAPEPSEASAKAAEPLRTEPPASDKARSGPLAEEVAILSRATAALHAGRGEDALRAVSEHQEKFPNGVLTGERRSARAQALCLLGRTSEAKRELDRLSPTSPQAARARERCGL